MTQAERLQAIEHQLQSLTAQFQAAADRGRDHGNKILNAITRIERELHLHTTAATNRYQMLNNRIDANNSRLVQITKLIDRIRTATTTPNPDPESPTPKKHLLPNREPSPISIDPDQYID